MDFCNCQYQTDSENIYYRRICLPIAIDPFFHTAVCTEARFIFEELAVWFTFLLNDYIALIGLVLLGKVSRWTTDQWTMASWSEVSFPIASINDILSSCFIAFQNVKHLLVVILVEYIK